MCLLIFFVAATIGRIASAQNFSVLKTFTGDDGSGPSGNLVLSGKTLYGTTTGGGSAGTGTIFKVNIDGTGFTVLKSFSVATNEFDIDGVGHFLVNSDGGKPNGLVLSGNTLYGTTDTGGNSGDGTVFKINTDGTGFTTLKVFTGSDGILPAASLTLSGNMLYGTTESGVFKVNTDGTGFAILKNFPNDQLIGGLTLLDNTLYGMTRYGNSLNSNLIGPNGPEPGGDGTVFKINTDGTGFAVLENFSSNNSGINTPSGSLIHSGDMLYGTSGGGNFGQGAIFKTRTDGTFFVVLKSFTGGAGGGDPRAALTRLGYTLYGTTISGGSANDGTVFRINLDGTGFIILKNFSGDDGRGPSAAITLSGNTLYGAAENGGSSGDGTIFRLELPPQQQN